VHKKQKNCDPTNPDDDHRGDYWDHVAFDPEHKLVLAVIPGARAEENARGIVAEVKQRVMCDPPPLMTSDEYPAYATAIEEVFSEPVPAPPQRKPGRRRVVPERRLPDDVIYATVHKHREDNRVVAVEQRQVFGSAEGLGDALGESAASHRVNTSFVERQNATDRGRNARKGRKTYRFSKDWQVHEAMTYVTLYSYNFCWCVRTLRVKDEHGHWQQRSPALAAKLTDHVWTWAEWFNRPAVQAT
jgi:IS1 family transposase